MFVNSLLYLKIQLSFRMSTCEHDRSIFMDVNGDAFDGQYLSTMCVDCKKNSCFHSSIRGNGWCEQCGCKATKTELIQHLSNLNEQYKQDKKLYGKKCPCEHGVSIHHDQIANESSNILCFESPLSQVTEKTDTKKTPLADHSICILSTNSICLI